MPWRGGGAAGCSQGQSERSLFSYLITVQAWRTAESVFLFFMFISQLGLPVLWTMATGDAILRRTIEAIIRGRDLANLREEIMWAAGGEGITCNERRAHGRR